jgi:hypothetical protein
MIYNTDPQFVDADGVDNTAGTLDDNLRLKSGSPAIDAGNNSAVPERRHHRPGRQRALCGHPHRPGHAATARRPSWIWAPMKRKIPLPPPSPLSACKPIMSQAGPASFTVQFNMPVADPPGHADQDDVTNPANYLLIEKGPNGVADTLSCNCRVERG